MTKRGLALLVLIVLVLSSVTVVAASDSECSGFIGFLECFFFGREDALVGGAGVALPNTEGEPTYDDKGRLINFVFEDGQTFSYRYDDNDNVVFEEIDYGGDGNIDVTVESEYNDDGTAVNVRSDYDVDGTVNEISRGEFDADDILVRNEVDSDGNGVIDTIRIRNSNGEMVDDPDFVPENSPSEPSADVSEIGVIDEVNEGADSDETPEPTETEGQIAHTGENSIPITTGRSTGDFRGTYNSENSKAIDGLLTYSNGATFEGTFDNNGNPEEGTYIEDGFSYVGTFLPDGEANTGIYIMDDGRNIIYTDGSSTFSSNAVTSDESVSNNGDEQPSRTETEESTLREQAQQDLGRAYEQLEDRIGWNDEGNLLIDGLPAEITTTENGLTTITFQQVSTTTEDGGTEGVTWVATEHGIIAKQTGSQQEAGVAELFGDQIQFDEGTPIETVLASESRTVYYDDAEEGSPAHYLEITDNQIIRTRDDGTVINPWTEISDNRDTGTRTVLHGSSDEGEDFEANNGLHYNRDGNIEYVMDFDDERIELLDRSGRIVGLAYQNRDGSIDYYVTNEDGSLSATRDGDPITNPLPERVAQAQERADSDGATEVLQSIYTATSATRDFPALSNLIFGGTGVQDWLSDAEQKFTPLLGEVWFPALICENARGLDIEPEGVAILRTPSGIDNAVASIQVERSGNPSPILCSRNPDELAEEEFICGRDQVCVEQFCYPTDENGRQTSEDPATGYFYKITWGVKAPADERLTPFRDEKAAVSFNVYLTEGTRDGVSIRDTPLYRKDGDINGPIRLKNGQSDNQLKIAYSTAEYKEACIKWQNPPLSRGDREPGAGIGTNVEMPDLCYETDISKVGIVNWEKSGNQPSSTVSGGEVEELDIY